MKIILKTNAIWFSFLQIQIQKKEEFKTQSMKWRKAPTKGEGIQMDSVFFLKTENRMYRRAYCAHYCEEESEEEPH